jgi:hypothetical protein
MRKSPGGAARHGVPGVHLAGGGGAFEQLVFARSFPEPGDADRVRRLVQSCASVAEPAKASTSPTRQVVVASGAAMVAVGGVSSTTIGS